LKPRAYRKTQERQVLSLFDSLRLESSWKAPARVWVICFQLQLNAKLSKNQTWI